MLSNVRLMLFFDGRNPKYALPVLAEYSLVGNFDLAHQPSNHGRDRLVLIVPEIWLGQTKSPGCLIYCLGLPWRPHWGVGLRPLRGTSILANGRHLLRSTVAGAICPTSSAPIPHREPAVSCPGLGS
jgi:hypothetical protein